MHMLNANYIIGLVDGEGSFTLLPSASPTTNGAHANNASWPEGKSIAKLKAKMH
ncbi:MAG: hypothetical protein ABIG60_00610 [Patescibacteria group bacterium]